MKTRFVEAWKKIGAQCNLDLEFNNLQTAYSQSPRFYHNLQHLKDCLFELDSAKHLLKQPDLVELAIWYHDIAYDTREKNNEEKSAQWAYNSCLNAKLSEKLADGVADFILATKHNTVPIGIDTGILVDIDLSILGKSVQKFDEYEKNIRKEYSWVSEEKFKQGRTMLLRTFLDREALYSTDFFRKKYETQARKNLQRSIDALK